MPILDQYRIQCWHGTDVQYRASTYGHLPAKLPFGAAPVVGIFRCYQKTKGKSEEKRKRKLEKKTNIRQNARIKGKEIENSFGKVVYAI